MEAFPYTVPKFLRKAKILLSAAILICSYSQAAGGRTRSSGIRAGSNIDYHPDLCSGLSLGCRNTRCRAYLCRIVVQADP